MTTPQPVLITVREAADLLGLPGSYETQRDRIVELCAAHHIHTERLSNRLYVSRAQFDAYVQRITAVEVPA